ncbi:hypothetical protein FJN14_17105 [Alteromonas mediterranea]|uniref:hypothetical protein n=1 Tax=Alteromonas mediterranea TaxID=314275 RepID=UPI0011316D2B|nr:hypothetical protein [Alteromonas mediterranea]QDG40082.1 hypothetical protein FJN14_17105 [Alteromonas mediterranea]
MAYCIWFDEFDKTVKTGPELKEEEFSHHFPGVEYQIFYEDAVTIDLSVVEWSSPSSLCYLTIVIHELTEKKIEVDIKLSEIGVSKSTDRFLKFLSTEGFLKAWTNFTTVYQNEYELNLQAPIIKLGEKALDENLYKKLSQIGEPLYISEGSCVPCTTYKVFKTLTKKNSSSIIKEVLESLELSSVEQIMSGIVSSIEKKVSINLRKIIEVKLREIVREVVHNIAEHAYRGEKFDDSQIGPGFYCVYIRLRKGWLNSDFSDLDNKALNIERQGAEIHRLDPYFIENRKDFLEVYIADTGRGLSQTTNDTLNSAMIKTFKKGYSRKSERVTELTGLQLINGLISKSNDYVRVHNSGEFWGAMLPIEKGNTEYINSEKKSFPYLRGTTWTFRIAIHDSLKSASELWGSLGEKNNEKARLAYKNNSCNFSEPRSVSFNGAVLYYFSNHAPILILNSNLGKSRIVALMREAVSAYGKYYNRESNSLFIVNINPESIQYLEPAISNTSNLFSSMEAFKPKNIILISTVYGFVLFILNKRDKYVRNRMVEKHNSKLPFDVETLSETLKKVDSLIFWSYALGQEDPSKWIEKPEIESNYFTFGEVDWGECKVNGYLDFHKAATSHQIRTVLVNALKKYIQLSENKNFTGVDGHIQSLLPIDIDKQKQSDVQYLASIAVTGRSNLEELNAVPKLYFFSHPDGFADVDSLFYWPDELKNKARYINQGWQQIGNTGKIARQGWKSIELPRFERGFSTYAETPSQTYEALQSNHRELIKLGHWHYGNKHDLLPINIYKAFDSELDQITIRVGSKLALYVFDNLSSIFRLKTKKDFTDEGWAIYRQIKDNPKNYSYRKFEAKKTVNSHLLIPNHPTMVHIVNKFIAFLRNESISSLLIKRLHFIPTSAWSSANIAPELLELRLKFEKLNEIEPISLVFLDDAQITGKSADEVLSFFDSLNIHKQRMILVDRTCSLTSGFTSATGDISFLRYDVPTLGTETQCIVCSTLKYLHVISESSVSSLIKHRIDKWSKLWAAKNELTDWIDEGLSAVPVKLINNEKKFSFNKEINEYEKIHITNSIGLLSWAIELQSITGRDDLILNMVNEESSKYESELTKEVKIKLICAQLLLFPNRTSSSVKVKLLSILCEILFEVENSHISSYTVLAGITIIAQENEILAQALSSKTIAFCFNIDASVVLSHIAMKKIPMASKQLEERAKAQIEASDKKSIYGRLHTNIKDVQGLSHSSELHRLLSHKRNIDLYFDSHGVFIFQSIAELVHSLNSGAFKANAKRNVSFYERALEEEVTNASAELRLLELDLLNLQSASRVASEGLMNQWKSIKNRVLNLLKRLDGLHSRVFEPIGLSELRLDRADRLTSELLKRDEIFNFSSYPELQFIDGTPVENKLIIEESSKSKKFQAEASFKRDYKEVYILWDTEIQEYFSDIVKNIKYAKIERKEDGTYVRNMHVLVEYQEDTVDIWFKNKPINSQQSLENISSRQSRLNNIKPEGVETCMCRLSECGNTYYVRVQLTYAHQLRG